MDSREKGRRYEEKAAEFLTLNGYKIIEKNFFARCGEIDIIAEDISDSYIVFFEVKYRQNPDFGMPFEAVDLRKQRKIIKAAKHYAAKKDLLERNFRFDVVEILGERIRIFKNAFEEQI